MKVGENWTTFYEICPECYHRSKENGYCHVCGHDENRKHLVSLNFHLHEVKQLQAKYFRER